MSDDEKSTVGIVFGIIGGFILNVVSSLAIGTTSGNFVNICSLNLYQNFSEVSLLNREPNH